MHTNATAENRIRPFTDIRPTKPTRKKTDESVWFLGRDVKHVLRRGKLKLADDVKTVRVYCTENVKLEIIYLFAQSMPGQTL